MLNKSARILHGIPEINVKAGQVGLVTAYLPEQRTFAIYFGIGQWVTFADEDEQTFLGRIEIVPRKLPPVDI